MADEPMTLGARILANMERAKTHPIDMARERAARRGQEEQFRIAEAFHDRVKKHVEDCVEDAEFPPPVRLTFQEERALEIRTKSGQYGEVSKDGIAYLVWEALVAWGDEQDLLFTWYHQHDGGGQDSWWTLRVSPNHA